SACGGRATESRTSTLEKSKDHVVTEQTEQAPGALTQPTMALAGISKSYGAVAALTDVSIELLPGEVHALLGENGAGKSTLMWGAAGTTQPDAGPIEVRGAPLAAPHPATPSRLGIATAPQPPAVLPDLTVAENLRVAVPKEFLQ